ncbi:reverse transcriptase/maturase family protein [Patescibacteria group bacterium]|nr:reverse transcriptase/maturase family protein [Patescibacteria group bacterium]
MKDRVLHHAVFRILYPIFDKSFISDSYSCRNDKGTHRAINRLQKFAGKVGKNSTKTCFVLKCDIKKFFDSINQDVLTNLIKKKIKDENAFWLIEKIIRSFNRGLPLGNITSQLFANIYLNKLDQFIKQKLRIKYYVRYCDDFIILSVDKKYLKELILEINAFLKNNLKLSLHPAKISIRKYYKGADFLGYVSFPCHRVLRTKTKRRMFKKINNKLLGLEQNKITKYSFGQTIQSYFGVLKHCNSYKLKNEISKQLSK